MSTNNFSFLPFEKEREAKDKEFFSVDPAITRYPSPIIDSVKQASEQEKIRLISEHFASILEILGMDLENESIKKTPLRIAKMYVQEVFSGLNKETFPDPSFIPDQNISPNHANTVFVKVSFTSFCEHHFVPFHGKAYISYLPNKKLIGLSKIPRIVRYFAKRPQVQERLTAQIADSLSIMLETENVAVSIIAEHFCVIARGIEDSHSDTITNHLRGVFESDENIRREFFEGINRQRH
ncbi:GTP cyclohydrolase 1 [Chlamydiales bacterium STE3]|nr:GTP cyclohydrolase 1 [Chlamydiales bacterium STE3]